MSACESIGASGRGVNASARTGQEEKLEIAARVKLEESPERAKGRRVRCADDTISNPRQTQYEHL